MEFVPLILMLLIFLISDIIIFMIFAAVLLCLFILGKRTKRIEERQEVNAQLEEIAASQKENKQSSLTS